MPSNRKPGGIVDCRVLEPADNLAAQVLQAEELDIDLDVMPGDLLFMAVGQRRAPLGIPGQAIEALTPQNSIHGALGDRHVGTVTKQE
jgi:hypothetical protein